MMFVFLFFAFSMLAPFIARAQATVPTFPNSGRVIAILQNIGDWIFVVGMLIVPVMIIIGATFFLTGGDDPSKIAKAKTIFLWTIVGTVLMLLARGVFSVIESIIGP